MEFPGGELRIVSQKEFPITTMTGATMLVNPGSVRELHWHPNADEWQFVLSGRARVTIFGAHARTKTAEFGQGEVGFVKQGFGHYIEQVGSEPLRMLFIFNSPVYEEINISTWLGANPASIVEDNFGLTKAVITSCPGSWSVSLLRLSGEKERLSAGRVVLEVSPGCATALPHHFIGCLLQQQGQETAKHVASNCLIAFVVDRQGLIWSYGKYPRLPIS